MSDRLRRWQPPTRAGLVVALTLVSLAAAVVATRFGGTAGPWLWNLDLPKIDYPLAVLFHQALGAGRLPLWNEDMGLGFPLYAEGQIGAFYPPNWLFFQLDPLVALDVSRVAHLVAAGVGTGLLTVRACGSRSGAMVAALVAVLGGAIVAKLEWHNLVAAYAFLPWILIPLVRRPAATRAGLVAAGLLFGVQAWTGHPNTWLLTGLAAAVVMLAVAPRARTIGRIIGFGLLGGAVGAVQLLPTAILTSLSVRSQALTTFDLFASAATPFDVLAFAFQNAFVRSPGGAWDPTTNWYPDGTFALLEAAAFVGLPVLALAAVAVRAPRARPFVALVLVGLAIPILAAFRPEPWLGIPILNGLRSPVRAYVVVALALGILAGIGTGRLGRSPRALRRASIAVAIPAVGYALTLATAAWLPEVFDQLLRASSTFLDPSDVPERRARAIAAMTTTWPLALEILSAAAILAVIAAAQRRTRMRAVMAPLAVVVAAIPLLLLGPLPNRTGPATDFSFADTPFVRAVGEAQPHRVVTLGPPGWYVGMPDQLAAAGIPDLRMFSSLDLLASDQVLRAVEGEDRDGALRRALGVDVVVTFGGPCLGEPIATVETEDAWICRDPKAIRPPYWIPDDAVKVAAIPSASPIRPREASLDLGVVRDRAVSFAPRATPDDPRADRADTLDVDVPASGWIWLDRTWWPTWEVRVDGAPVEILRALGGQLVHVDAGRHEIRQTFLPRDALVGVGMALIATGVALAWVWRGRRSRVA